MTIFIANATITGIVEGPGSTSEAVLLAGLDIELPAGSAATLRIGDTVVVDAKLGHSGKWRGQVLTHLSARPDGQAAAAASVSTSAVGAAAPGPGQPSSEQMRVVSAPAATRASSRAERFGASARPTVAPARVQPQSPPPGRPAFIELQGDDDIPF